MQHEFGTLGPNNYDSLIGVDGGAALGINPSVSKWVIVHGSGGGHEEIYTHFGESHANELWDQAGRLVEAGQLNLGT